MVLQEMESEAGENEELYKHSYKLVVIASRGITHIALGHPRLVDVASTFPL